MSHFDCRSIRLSIRRYRAGQLSRDDTFAMMDHLDVCPHCAAMFATQLFSGESGSNGQSTEPGLSMPQPFDDFTSEVLAKTSGSACPDVQWHMACGYDQPVENIDPAPCDPVLNQHMEHCSACREFQQTLPRVMDVMHRPELWEPDPFFVNDVLDETSRCWVSRIRKRLQQWAAHINSAIIERPRFALETAYVATLILILLVQWTGIPISHASESSVSPPSVIERLSRHRDTIHTQAVDLADDTRDAVRDSAEKTWNAILGFGSDAVGWLLKHLEDSNGNKPRNGNNEIRG